MASADAIFISYRRDGGTEHVRTFQEFLEGQGYDVFLDVDGLTSGHFNKQLLGEIERRSHFVLICSAGCLDRCREEGDWIRAEVAHAIQLNRNIVPIVIPGFVWPKAEALPPEIRELSANNAFLYSFAHWKSIRSELARRFPRGRTEAESPAWRFVRTFLPQIRKLGAIPAADRGSKNPLLLDAAKNFLECARPSEAREVIERSPAKEGWFCPSCHQKKVQVFGAMLAESILAVVPHRHFTFTIPKMLRPYFRFQLGFNLDYSSNSVVSRISA